MTHQVGDELLAAVREGCGRIHITGERGRARPDCHLEVILRVLATRGNRVPIEAVPCTQDGVLSQCPSNADPWPPVVVDRPRRKEALAGQDDVTEVGIRLECIRYAR